MHVDPPNSIRPLHTAVSSANATPRRDARSKQNSKPSAEPSDVELQLSEQAANLPKHQRARDDAQAPATIIAPQGPTQSDDDRLDVTV